MREVSTLGLEEDEPLRRMVEGGEGCLPVNGDARRDLYGRTVGQETLADVCPREVPLCFSGWRRDISVVRKYFRILGDALMRESRLLA